jgi:dGTPase
MVCSVIDLFSHKNFRSKMKGREDIFAELSSAYKEREKKYLHPKAAYSADHRRRSAIEADHRPPYKRDVDRIIHSKSYARYVDKTQVVYLVHNDHITQRSLHVQLVSNFSRSIASVLRLNEDLVEAIALGHDVGHPPFGHEGEGYLSEISLKHGNGSFSHSVQSCRLFSEIEPLNLGEAVYDGFLCHDGGGRKQNILQPQFGKSWDEHMLEREKRKSDPNCDLTPATLEGATVRWSDTMSYIGRDIEDAIQLGIIRREEIPITPLGKSNSEMLTYLACDLIENSYQKDYIAISEESSEALKALRAFNFSRIYTFPKLKQESTKIERSYSVLFDLLLDDFVKNGDMSHVSRSFLLSRSEEYLAKTAPVQIVIDYMAGMTDTYFIKTLQKFLVPTMIDWNL